MSSSTGNFVWYEIATTEADAAEAFYRAVIGWGARDASGPTHRYAVLTVGETGVGGLMALPGHSWILWLA